MKTTTVPTPGNLYKIKEVFRMDRYDGCIRLFDRFNPKRLSDIELVYKGRLTIDHVIYLETITFRHKTWYKLLYKDSVCYSLAAIGDTVFEELV